MKNMKIFLISFFLITFSLSIFGQSTDFEETIRTQHSDTIVGWKAGGEFSLQFSQVSFYLKNPQNIDVYWEVILNLKDNKFISAQLTTNLIYDDDVLIPYDSTGDGVLDSSRPNVQFKELVGVGLAVDF